MATQEMTQARATRDRTAEADAVTTGSSRSALTEVGDYYRVGRKPENREDDRDVALLVGWVVGRYFGGTDHRYEAERATAKLSYVEPSRWTSRKTPGMWRVYDQSIRRGNTMVAGAQSLDLAMQKALALGATGTYATQAEAQAAADERTTREARERKQREDAVNAEREAGLRFEADEGSYYSLRVYPVLGGVAVKAATEKVLTPEQAREMARVLINNADRIDSMQVITPEPVVLDTEGE